MGRDLVTLLDILTADLDASDDPVDKA